MAVEVTRSSGMIGNKWIHRYLPVGTQTLSSDVAEPQHH